MNTNATFGWVDLIGTLLLVTFLNTTLYATTYYVSKSGNDNNSGSQSQPFLTISKAASIAVAGDVVNITEGTYEETLRPANSGTAGNPIIFQAVPGQKVIITAMQALSGFTADSGGRYKKTVSWDLGQRNFVMSGNTVLDLARWPNNTDGDRFTLNSLRNDGGSQDEVSTNAFLTDSDIPNWNWANGGSLMFYGDRQGSGWTTWRAFIKSSSQGRINFDAIKNQGWIISSHPPGDLGDYYLEGIKEALDYQNEWYFDSSTKTLYVQLPNGAAPANGQVQMARREMTVDLTSRSYIHLKNLAVFGGNINIKGTGNYIYQVTSLYGSMTRGITPNFNSGVNAINVDWNAVNTTIEKCEIGFGDGSGIWDSGTNTTIKNCYIHDFDMLGSYDAPLMVRGQSGAKVLNNKVTRGGRDALQIISKGSEVAYNDFSYSNLIADDCALLYTIGPNLNMDIHHNWFHDAASRGSLKKAAGIYLDNDAGDVRVYRNVVWNVEWTNIQINWNGTDIDVFNNTLVKADGGTMGAWHKAGTQFTNVKVWNNITDEYATDQGGNQETEGTWEPQSDKQNNLVDKTSFTNFSGNDYRLKSNTPAIDYGRVISGYTNGYVGSAPDVGAYELGDNWTPGVNWDITQGPTGICYGLPGEGCGITPPADCSTPPSNVAVSNTTNTSATVTFDNTADDQRTFELRAFLGGTFNGDINSGAIAYKAGGKGSSAITITGLTQGTTYDFVLRALCSPGASSNVVVSGTPGGPIQTPYGGTAHAIPGKVEAEYYDLGGQGVAFNDNDNNNSGGQFRTDGVDIETTGDSNGGNYNIGWMNAGEWLEYTVNVSTTQLYDFYPRVASINGSGQFKILVDGVDVTGNITVPNTGNWQTYQTLHIRDINMTAGTHVIRFEVVATGMNLNYWAAWKAQNTARLANTETPSSNKAQEFSIYPNPATNGVINLIMNTLSEKATFYIVDINGRTVKTNQITDMQSAINITDLQKGIYLLKVKEGDFTSTKRFMIK